MTVLVASAASLSGCEDELQVTRLPSGHLGYALSCSGNGNDWNDCYQQAGQACQNGYNVVSKDGDSGNSTTDGSYRYEYVYNKDKKKYEYVYRYGTANVNYNTRTMLVECKA